MHQLELEVERPSDLPDDAYWDMVNASIELRRQEAAAAQAYEEGLRQLRREYAEEARAIIMRAGGAKDAQRTLQKYLAFRESHEASMRSARDALGATRQSEAQFAETRRRLVQDSAAFLKGLRIDAGELGRLQREFEEKSEDVFELTLGKGAVVSEELHAAVKNQTFTPPFHGHLASVSHFVSKGEASDNVPNPVSNLFVDHSLGKLGNNSAIWVSNASDYDEAQVYVKTALLRWHQMPSTGQVRVRFKAEVVAVNRSGSVCDESGSSSLALKQRVRFYAQVISPSVTPKVLWPAPVWGGGIPPSTAIGWVYDDNETDDHAWSWGQWSGFEVVGSNLVVPDVFADGTWVLVKVGVAHRNRFFANDSEVASSQISQYFVKEIGISSTG